MVSNDFVLERSGRLAEGLQLADDLDFVGQALLSLGRQPMQEAGQRRPVAAVSLAGAFDLHGVLAGPWQGAGIGRGQGLGLAVLQGLEIPGRRSGGVGQHGLALEAGQGRRQVVRALQPHLVAEPGRQIGGHLDRIEEQARRSVGGQDRLRQGGRAGDIAAANVEQPGDRGRAVITAALAPCSRKLIALPTRARFEAESSPE